MAVGYYIGLDRGMFRSKKLTDGARDQACTLQIPGVCNCRKDTTVACHSNWQSEGKGVGLKAHDWATVFGCSACHDALDRDGVLPDEEKRRYFLEAFIRTTGLRFARGEIVVG